MNRRITITIAVAAALAVGTFAVLSQSGVLAGDTQTPPTATAGPAPMEKEAPVVETPEPPTLAEKLQADAGMTDASYAALVSDVTAMDLDGMTLPEVGPAFDAVAAAYGMPVVLIEHYQCPISGLPSWGITGALAGPNAGCGTGWTQTVEGALEKVAERAERRGWSSGDYAVVVLG